MKRILILLLACCLLLSFAACSSIEEEDEDDDKISDRPNKTEGEETKENSGSAGHLKDDFVGEWYMFEGSYGSDGHIVSVELVCLELNEDGSATFKDQEGAWKYRSKMNVVEAVFKDETFTYEIVDVDGYTGLQVYDHGGYDAYMFTFLQEDASLKGQVTETLTGNWYGYNNTAFQFHTLTFVDDGSLLYQGEKLDRQWSLLSMGPYVFLEYGEEFPYVLDLENLELFFYCDDVSGSFYPEKYCTVITPENWQDYFAENLEDNFEITYTVELVYDEWGEISRFYVTGHIRLPDSESFNDASFLTVEYLNDGIGDYVTVDPDSFEVTVTQDEAYVYEETITITISKQFYDLEFEYSDRTLTNEDFTVKFVSHGKIIRMRGLLINNP